MLILMSLRKFHRKYDKYHSNNVPAESQKNRIYMAGFQKIEKSSGWIPNCRKFKRSNYKKKKLSKPGTGVEHEPSRIFFFFSVRCLVRSFRNRQLSLVWKLLSAFSCFCLEFGTRVFARILGLKISWRIRLTGRVVWGKGPTAFSFIGDMVFGIFF